ncbi:MAG: mannitol-1-phosphate 5-dehydrogenase, partial [bacterium]
MKLIQFGAGNIGRSFVGQLFSKAGYEVVFIDIDNDIINALNQKRSYNVEIRDYKNHIISVNNVRGINVQDTVAVINEIKNADICATAVGPKILPKLYPILAQGIKYRYKSNKNSLDIILCENLRNAAHKTSTGLKALLPPDFPLDTYIGLVETSIGKMVPIIPMTLRANDPLTVYAEAYNTLILDKKGFINPVPDVHGLTPKDDMKAYVDRKSFIHNLGHASLAYFARLVAPEMIYTYEAIENPDLRHWVKQTMLESGRLLIKMYPGEFNEQNQEEHIEDLLNRFGNRALSDTIYRVGRDLNRKLSSEDRVAGPLLENQKNKLLCPWTALTMACGLYFHAVPQDENPLAGDFEITQRAKITGPES